MVYFLDVSVAFFEASPRILCPFFLLSHTFTVMSLLALVELIISSNYGLDESYFAAGGHGRDKVGMD